jgi:electron transfer flavoprotein alpha subunit
MSVLVVLEQSGGVLHRMSWEAVAAAAQFGKPVTGVVLGGLPAGLDKGGLERILVLEHSALATYTADGFANALEKLIRERQPEYVVFPHTYQVRDYAPKLATRFNQVLVSDVIEIRGDTLVRQLFQGKLNADVKAGGAEPHFLSVQAGAFRADQLPVGAAPVETVAAEPGEIRTRPEAPFRESQRAVDLTAADVIVSVGRGIKEKENIPIVEELAGALGAELAASRPICDNGWLPMERQVGSSGQTVSPKVYIAVGISGAIQHLVGMKGAKTIVAINKDPEAPIFEVADYGIVGDLFEVIPALTEEVKKAKA